LVDRRRIVVALTLFALMTAGHARADTICPTVSNTIQSLPVTITGSSVSGQGFYDPTTQGLIFEQTAPGNRSLYFIGVPNAVVIGHEYLPWVTLETYPQAVVQDQSTCPILLSDGKPLAAGGSMFPTVSPMVHSPCSLISDNTEIVLLSLMNPPYSVYLATYDRKTQFINIKWVNGDAALFVDVPYSLVSNAGVLQWADLASYSQSLMLENSACPLVLQGSAG
jgi:hypothetical protein